MTLMRDLAGTCPSCIGRVEGERIDNDEVDPNKPDAKYQCPNGHTWFDWPKQEAS